MLTFFLTAAAIMLLLVFLILGYLKFFVKPDATPKD